MTAPNITIDGGVTISGGVTVKGSTYQIGNDNPANAAEPNATAWVLMDGPFYNTPGVPASGFVGGQSWRKMAPTGYFPYGKDTYVSGDETVRWNGANWLYENSTTGTISTGTAADYPWLSTWTTNYKGIKITGSYSKSSNYPSLS